MLPLVGGGLFPLDEERPAGFEHAVLHLVDPSVPLAMQHRRQFGASQQLLGERFALDMAVFDQAGRRAREQFVQPAMAERNRTTT